MITTENNKLIADFMGSKTNKTALQNIAERMSDNQLWLPFHGIEDIKSLKYHSNWNWLMEVVEKIEGLEIDKLSFNFKIEKDRVSFFYTHTDEPKKQTEMFFEWGQKTKIGNTYKIVLEFIKWYNQQKN